MVSFYKTDCTDCTETTEEIVRNIKLEKLINQIKGLKVQLAIKHWFEKYAVTLNYNINFKSVLRFHLMWFDLIWFDADPDRSALGKNRSGSRSWT